MPPSDSPANLPPGQEFQLARPLIEAVNALAREAGIEVLRVYRSDFAVQRKDDQSPVTEADENAEAIILEGLTRLTPDIPVVSEEAAAAGLTPAFGRRFWLVDPLDGTREFIKRNDEFTVNIGLIDDGVPVFGVVHAPALGELYWGGRGWGAHLEKDGSSQTICARATPPEGATIVASRSHRDDASLTHYLEGVKVAQMINAGSSLKLCLVARGVADQYPRFGTTMEWDIAAGHAVLAAAGGSVQGIDGSPFRYGKADLRNTHFVARGR